MLLPHQPGSKTFIDNMAAELGLDLEKIVIWQHSPGLREQPVSTSGVYRTDAFEWRDPRVHGMVSVSWGNVQSVKPVMSFFKRKGEEAPSEGCNVNGSSQQTESGRGDTCPWWDVTNVGETAVASELAKDTVLCVDCCRCSPQWHG